MALCESVEHVSGRCINSHPVRESNVRHHNETIIERSCVDVSFVSGPVSRDGFRLMEDHSIGARVMVQVGPYGTSKGFRFGSHVV